MMKVLVIGGSSHVGPYLVSRLAEGGYEVVVANRGRTPVQFPGSVERVVADINQPGSLAGAIAGRTFDAVIHMIPSGVANTRTVLEVVHGLTGRYLQCGSTGVFAPLPHVPGDETCPQNPPAKFGGFDGKVIADQTAAELCSEWNLPLVVLRPTNIIGPGNIPIDIWGARSPQFFQRIIDGQIISIPNDGRTLLQPVHADDMARSFVLALEHPEVAGDFNISCSYAITLNRYVELLGEALGREPVVEHVPQDELIRLYGDSDKLNVAGLLFLCEHMCFDLTKARQLLGYQAQHEPESSVPETVQWMFDRGDIQRR